MNPVTSADDASQAALALLDKGCGSVIVTLGEKGCVYVTKDNREAVHVPCDKVKAIDTTVSYPSLSCDREIKNYFYLFKCAIHLFIQALLKHKSLCFSQILMST